MAGFSSAWEKPAIWKRPWPSYKNLRTQAAGGKEDTPCNDKDIELTLGRHLQLMGGADNLQEALAIFTRLRTRAAGGKANTPCNDKDLELALGMHLQLMGGADNHETGPGYLYPTAHPGCWRQGQYALQ